MLIHALDEFSREKHNQTSSLSPPALQQLAVCVTIGQRAKTLFIPSVFLVGFRQVVVWVDSSLSTLNPVLIQRQHQRLHIVPTTTPTISKKQKSSRQSNDGIRERYAAMRHAACLLTRDVAGVFGNHARLNVEALAVWRGSGDVNERFGRTSETHASAIVRHHWL